MIHSERIQHLNSRAPADRDHVLYWMQASQRDLDNHALEYAVDQANARSKPLLVCFVLTDAFPEAGASHYRFMLQGLLETVQRVKARGAACCLRMGDPVEQVTHTARRSDLVVTDRGYLRIQKAWRRNLAGNLDVPLIQVESDVLVPAETASAKEAYSAGTFRPGYRKQRDRFLVSLNRRRITHAWTGAMPESESLESVDPLLKKLKIRHREPLLPVFHGGTSHALSRLQAFIGNRLDRFDDWRNDPSRDYVSHLSPYLHFGQISPLTIALAVLDARSPGEESFLEELLVRRELAVNFVHYNDVYDRYDCLPAWAKTTLAAHANDPREYVYDLHTLENAQTHDPFWNAAQKEMRLTGKMHGYMRMYWGKKILEWSAAPEEAFRNTLYLNNRYELDGRDPNGFAGTAWCFGKHDRAWAERAVYGKVRYMNANGLRRKFDIQAYVSRIQELERGMMYS